jgi:type II restriction/modification system DNA methylase subunit YeeA
MIVLKKRYYETTDERPRDRPMGKVLCQQLGSAIKATDEQIDHIVYKLYNLTDEEIRVVEGSIKYNF